jgi:hypothetical protein
MVHTIVEIKMQKNILAEYKNLSPSESCVSAPRDIIGNKLMQMHNRQKHKKIKIDWLRLRIILPAVRKMKKTSTAAKTIKYEF